MRRVKKVQVITDGACLGNPGPGGWAAILRHGPHKKELFGCEKHTTNNRMELTAAIQGLRAIKEQCEVEVVTDSEYVKNGITQWIEGWKRRNWRTAAGDPVANVDLWRRLAEAAAPHHVEWRWLRGHAGDPMNELVPRLVSLCSIAGSARMELNTPFSFATTPGGVANVKTAAEQRRGGVHSNK